MSKNYFLEKYIKVEDNIYLVIILKENKICAYIYIAFAMICNNILELKYQ